MTGAQTTLHHFEADLSALTPAEKDAYEAVEIEDYGVREFARKTGRRPGTVGNLLSRARGKVGGEGS
ncbi:RNA polymerase, sigma-24 subunit, ECF subfamily [Halorhabdus utahensis DSM 12940]|uniref:RNA polymerase, sigma-24 subunit, ECF subfamily n=1 Tax=Halorhabdus utahensis (strain DSM 12940 / JCM 11049 / AX-2) TaxID=519442 RepID=C7NU94_HALUD|nr:sigma-70 region 4 domain-containing protein [Halorhabdus utahensis]ACV10991.1 RNA polymerase, sigma-24 subunit, ECF subfamily [Halorhabdus utahensis DSM 12940]